MFSLYEKKDTNGYDKFIFGDNTFYLPECNFSLKLMNFTHSSIEGYFDTDKPNNNDIEYFVRKLIKYVDFEPCDDETKKFLSLLKGKETKMGQMMSTKNENFEELLNNPYFETFKTKPSMVPENDNDSYIYGSRKLKSSKKNIQKGGAHLLKNHINLKMIHFIK